MHSQKNDDVEKWEALYPTKELKVLQRYDTEYCSDSVEWCPHEPYQNMFVCANYQVVEPDGERDASESVYKSTERFGRILLFALQSKQLQLCETINTSAVLDQKWCHIQIDGHPVLAVVTAKKSIDIYKLTPELKLESVTSYTFIDDGTGETLILSLDWSTGRTEGPVEIVCSDSKGNAHVLKYDEERLVLIDSYHLHKYEAWIAAFDYWNPNIIYTGGDDNLFNKLDRRLGADGVIKNSKTHEAGVTCIHANPSREHVVATGSYDGKLRIWDTRVMKSPRLEMELPGTLWRLKWDPFNQDYLLTACMHGGVHIVEAKNEDSAKIVESFYEHQLIAYGADWCHLPKNKVNGLGVAGNTVIGSCSFYDHLLCVSTVNL